MSNSSKNTGKLQKYSLKQLLRDHTNLIRKNDDIKCIPCNKSFNYDKNRGFNQIKTHCSGPRCKKRCQINTDQKKFFNNGYFDQQKFEKQFTLGLATSNIPFSAISNTEYRLTFESVGVFLKSRNYYTDKVLNREFQRVQQRLKNEILERPFGLKFDESTDRAGRKILTVQVFLLKNDQYSKSYTIWSGEIDNTKATTVFKAINDQIKVYITNSDQKRYLKAVISDGAAYCRLVGRLLKAEYPELVFIVCLCHNLHNLATSIALNLDQTSVFLSFLGGLFKNNQKNRILWRMATGLPNFPTYSKTRWGKWLECANFVSKNLIKIKIFIDQYYLANPHAEKVQYSQKDLENELNMVEQYMIIPKTIAFLESDGLSLYQQIEAYVNVLQSLTVPADISRFNNILSKNEFVSDLCDKYLKKQKLSKNVFNYLNLTNASVERYFSHYNRIFSPQRRKFKASTISKLIMITENTK